MSFESGTPYNEGRRALDALRNFLTDISPDLEASVEVRKVILDTDPKNPIVKKVLVFRDSSAGVEWTMDINEEEDYLNYTFERVVRNVYAEKIAELN